MISLVLSNHDIRFSILIRNMNNICNGDWGKLFVRIIIACTVHRACKLTKSKQEFRNVCNMVYFSRCTQAATVVLY